MQFNSTSFTKDLLLKRSHANRMGMREAAAEIGLSVATYSRIERGKTPDLINYALACKWLDESMDKYLIK